MMLKTKYPEQLRGDLMRLLQLGEYHLKRKGRGSGIFQRQVNKGKQVNLMGVMRNNLTEDGSH